MNKTFYCNVRKSRKKLYHLNIFATVIALAIDFDLNGCMTFDRTLVDKRTLRECQEYLSLF